jgi:hypothetical protein
LPLVGQVAVAYDDAERAGFPRLGPRYAALEECRVRIEVQRVESFHRGFNPVPQPQVRGRPL